MNAKSQKNKQVVGFSLVAIYSYCTIHPVLANLGIKARGTLHPDALPDPGVIPSQNAID